MTVINNNKIVILTIFSLQGGGAERFVLTLAEGFKQLGYVPHIVCFKQHTDYALPDVPVHYIPYQSYRWLPKSIRHRIFAKVFDAYVQEHITSQPKLVLSNLWQVDMTLTHSQLPNIAFVIHNTLSKEKQVHTYLSDDKIKAVYSYKHIVAVSQGVLQDFQNIVPEVKSLTCIYNPIDKLGIIHQANRLSEPLVLHQSQLTDGYLVHVGKFKQQKNHKLLIRAYAKSSQQLPLVLVGQGELQTECEQLVATLGIQDKVLFVGFQQNPYPWIANATAMILSSDYEGFGIVIAEALALGVPVISTDCESGPRELLPVHNLVNVADEQELTEKLTAVMQSPFEFISSFDEDLLPTQVAAEYLRVVG